MVGSKQDLRKNILASRIATPEPVLTDMNEQIAWLLKDLYSWNKIKTLHVYESIDSLNEVDTKSFTTYIKEHYPEVEIYTARKIKGEWLNVSLNGKPDKGVKFDVVVAPMIGFDEHLNRLGYGGGYYDKFLSLQTNAIKIGLCFELGHTEILPVESFDIPMNFVVSEKQIYRGNSILEGRNE